MREQRVWPEHFGSPRPHQLLTKDLCIIKGNDFFVRGVIEIPVHDYKHEFGWGVWVSHKRENSELYRDNFESAAIGPFFGWLCTKIEFYPEPTLSLKRQPIIGEAAFAPNSPERITAPA